jgi:hypothetical protein
VLQTVVFVGNFVEHRLILRSFRRSCCFDVRINTCLVTEKIRIDSLDFALQSRRMESNWAAEHLQVIRTLMERSALYRRALAPIMIFTGLVGLGGGVLGWVLKINLPQGFVGFWAGVGVLALIGSFLLVRRQAIKESEPFWSPPTRRVAQALSGPLFIGSVAGLLALVCPSWDFLRTWGLPGFWMLLYGCALTAAGFFMHRGIKLLGWLFVLCGCGLMATRCQGGIVLSLADGHKVMGAVFGGLHLAYGVYLYFTEPRGNET